MVELFAYASLTFLFLVILMIIVGKSWEDKFNNNLKEQDND